MKNNKYKIGKSRDIKTRLKSSEYRNADIILIKYLDDIHECERRLIKEFTEKFKIIRSSSMGSYGFETFEGDIDLMKATFEQVCDEVSVEETDSEHDIAETIDVPSHTFTSAAKLLEGMYSVMFDVEQYTQEYLNSDLRIIERIKMEGESAMLKYKEFRGKIGS